MKKTGKYTFLLIVLAAFLWSLDGLLRRELYSLPPIAIVLIEHVIGFLVLLPFILRYRKEIKQIKLDTWYVIGIVALLSGVLGTLFYTSALVKINFIPFSVVVLIQKLQPVFAIAAAAMLLKEKITAKFIGWAVIALAAGYFVSFPELQIDWHNHKGEIIAAILALLAAMAWGASTAFSRYGLLRVRYPLMVGLRFFGTIVFSIPLLFILGASSSLTAITGKQMFLLLVIALTTGMVAMLIYYRGLRKVPARVSTIAELFWPVSAIFIDYFYFGGRLTATQWLGVFILLYSIYHIGVSYRNDSIKADNKYRDYD